MTSLLQDSGALLLRSPDTPQGQALSCLWLSEGMPVLLLSSGVTVNRLCSRIRLQGLSGDLLVGLWASSMPLPFPSGHYLPSISVYLPPAKAQCPS